MNKVPMTKRGETMLREELADLKGNQRPVVIQAIADAREHGDLKENAEYHAAREQQSFIEGRIKEIDAKLSTSQVIDITSLPNNGKVVFGATASIWPGQSAPSLIQVVRVLIWTGVSGSPLGGMDCS